MRASKFKWLADMEGDWLCIKLRLPEIRALLSSLNSTKQYEVTVKEHKERRSLDANRYMWKILGDMAEALHTTKESLYKSYIKDVGIYKDFILTEDEAKTFNSAWLSLGTGWFTEQVDFAEDGETLVIRAYYGSSKYNTKQMSRLIDAVVSGAKDLGVETMPPSEIAMLKYLWRKNE